MKKILLLSLSILVLTGCETKEKVTTTAAPVTETVAEEKEPVVKLIESDNKKTEDAEAEDTEKSKEQSEDTEEKKDEAMVTQMTFTDLKGDNYVCSFDDNTYTLSVIYKNENFSSEIRQDIYDRIKDVIDYASANTERYKKQSIAYGVPEGKVDLDGWIGDMLFSFAKNRDSMEDGRTYYEYAIECLEELEDVKGIYVSMGQNDTENTEETNTEIENIEENTQDNTEETTTEQPEATEEQPQAVNGVMSEAEEDKEEASKPELEEVRTPSQNKSDFMPRGYNLSFTVKSSSEDPGNVHEFYMATEQSKIYYLSGHEGSGGNSYNLYEKNLSLGEYNNVVDVYNSFYLDAGHDPSAGTYIDNYGSLHIVNEGALQQLLTMIGAH